MRPLDEKLFYNDPSDSTTVGGYLCEIFLTLLQEQEGFSCKRPLGDSDWMFPIYAALVRGGWIEGSFDQDDFLETADTVAGDLLIQSEIELLFEG
jgi:hypothetical protein